VYFSAVPSVNLYQNREYLTDGMMLRITCAVTRGDEPTGASLTVLLDPPDGPVLYLPIKTENYATIRTEPLTSQYMLLLNERITNAWQDGTYIVRAWLTSDEGALLAEEMITYSVSRDEGILLLIFPHDVGTKMVTGSRIRLTDASTREIMLEQSTDGPKREIALTLPAGTYLISGECTTADDNLWIIPAGSANQAVIHAGGTTMKELSFLPPVAGRHAEAGA
jgi:hypothetical protein